MPEGIFLPKMQKQTLEKTLLPAYQPSEFLRVSLSCSFMNTLTSGPVTSLFFLFTLAPRGSIDLLPLVMCRLTSPHCDQIRIHPHLWCPDAQK